MTVGHDVWLATARRFAHQLQTEGRFNEAVMYFLAVGDVRSAVTVYHKADLYP